MKIECKDGVCRPVSLEDQIKEASRRKGQCETCGKDLPPIWGPTLCNECLADVAKKMTAEQFEDALHDVFAGLKERIEERSKKS